MGITFKDIARLDKAYNEALSLNDKLSLKLQELSTIASEIYGQQLNADICSGSEIEFRISVYDVLSDDESCIRIEDIIEKYENNK